jgi:hypothetical protein
MYNREEELNWYLAVKDRLGGELPCIKWALIKGKTEYVLSEFYCDHLDSGVEIIGVRPVLDEHLRYSIKEVIKFKDLEKPEPDKEYLQSIIKDKIKVLQESIDIKKADIEELKKQL